MSANSSLDLLNLDPDLYKKSLVQFLSNQTQFQSFDFTGTNMDILLSLLARNTFEYVFYLNMINAESWLDSNQLRSSAVSRAKELSYLPGSATSASANLNVQFDTNNLNVVLFPKGTPFIGRSGLTTLTFTTDQNLIYTSTNGYFDIQSLNVYEGFYVQDNFIIDYTQPDQRFILSNPGIDISSIDVNVIEDSGSSTLNYQQYSSLLDVKSTTYAYFLQATSDTKYEVEFGDGILGRRPKNGALVTVTYRVTQGTVGNGVQDFILSTDITNGLLVGSVIVASNLPSSGGTSAETIESIQYNAPRSYQVQERATSESDYELLLKNQFPEIDAIAVFGGETLIPPQYGKVFISVDIAGVNGIPASKQQQYYNFIKPRCPMFPVFQSPTYLYYQVTSTVNYNENITTLKPADIETLLFTSLINYNTSNYNDFKVTFRQSPLGTTIDNVHPAIISNETDILIYQKVFPIFGNNYSVSLSYGFPIYDQYPVVSTSHPANETHAVYSDFFIYNSSTVFLEDDGNGILRIVQTVNDTDIIVKNIGTVDYINGNVVINNLNIDSILNNTSFNVYVQSQTKDIPINGNRLLTLEADGLKFTAVQVNE